jgi:hypothetical protein
METATLIGYSIVIIFLCVVIIQLWRDNLIEKRNYDKWNSDNEHDT